MDEIVTQIPPWFDRKFEFSLPVELLPNLLARLRGTPARLEEELREHAPEALSAKPNEKWSMHEHAGHMLDLEPLWLARVEDYVKGEVELTSTDLGNRKTDEADHNTQPVEEILLAFRSERQKLLQRADELDRTLFAGAIPHPRLRTPMRLIDHLYFVAEHDDHHLARIWEMSKMMR